MKREDKRALVESADLLFMLIHTRCEIAQLVVKNQNAPKYLYEQANDLQRQVLEVFFDIEVDAEPPPAHDGLI